MAGGMIHAVFIDDDRILIECSSGYVIPAEKVAKLDTPEHRRMVAMMAAYDSLPPFAAGGVV